MKISADMDNFNPKSLKAVSSTLLSTPNYKMISGITYNNDRLEVGNDFGYEKKGLFAGIVRPKKSIIFNKNIYRDFIDASYAEINT